ncbi:hypothetical protein GLOIN_2v1584672 [Rhizophagus clarus]|uniref:Restriction of telomere capping protein 4 n=1 Tax=Rhizophagus clarus TaxID=94130 RepID=A0A8H3QW80_9GLOM|nr:hypothetical protein GLOIN_2v1584672 [Rhizophagus clarus]
MLISDADNCNIDVDLLKSNVALRSANLWYLKECWPDAIMSEIKNSFERKLHSHQPKVSSDPYFKNKLIAFSHWKNWNKMYQHGILLQILLKTFQHDSKVLHVWISCLRSIMAQTGTDATLNDNMPIQYQQPPKNLLPIFHLYQSNELSWCTNNAKNSLSRFRFFQCCTSIMATLKTVLRLVGWCLSRTFNRFVFNDKLFCRKCRKCFAIRIKEPLNQINSNSSKIQGKAIKKFKRNNKENTREFRMPSPIRFTEYNFNEIEIEFLTLEELELIDLDHVDKTKDHCPFCEMILPNLMSDRLRIAFENSKKGKLAPMEFCYTHYAELLVVPDGVVKNYPLNINFDELPNRIRNFKDNLEEIIEGTARSYYRNLAMRYYKKHGPRKSATSMGLYGRFKELRPGYYGTKGNLMISDVLIKLFLNTGILTHAKTYPLKPMNYLSDVLVPETAMRLILEDTGGNGSLEDAREIMVSSGDFGDWVHNDGTV